MLYTGNLNKSITMNTLISIGCIIFCTLPYGPMKLLKFKKILKKTRILR